MIKSIQSLFLRSAGRFEMRERPYEEARESLQSNQVMVQMLNAPINPSDFYFTLNAYFDKKPMPCIPGFEGLGRIIEVGSSVSKQLIGQKVACHFFDSTGGAYSTHSITEVNKVFPVDEKIDPLSFPFLVNPITSIGLLELAQKSNTEWFVQNGASTSVGKLLLLLNRHSGSRHPLKSINIVRNDVHREFLESIGADFILSQNDGNFPKFLKEALLKHSPKIGFDCLAGDHTGTLFNAMPKGSSLWVYGALDIRHCSNIDPQHLIFMDKTIKGFHAFRSFLKDQPLSSIEQDLKTIYTHWQGDRPPKVFDLENYAEAFKYFRQKNEKVILQMNTE